MENTYNNVSVLNLSEETLWWMRRIGVINKLDFLLASLRSTNFHVKGFPKRCFLELLDKASEYTCENFYHYFGLIRNAERLKGE